MVFVVFVCGYVELVVFVVVNMLKGLLLLWILKGRLICLMNLAPRPLRFIHKAN